jgi:GTPase-activating protein SAC7
MDAAGVLLKFLLTLPEPLIPLDRYEDFRAPFASVASDIDEDAMIKSYHELMNTLVAIHRQSLRYFLDLMAVFASKDELNKMSVTKLAAIFQPGILSHPNHANDPREYALNRDILSFLVEHEEEISKLNNPGPAQPT